MITSITVRLNSFLGYLIASALMQLAKHRGEVDGKLVLERAWPAETNTPLALSKTATMGRAVEYLVDSVFSICPRRE
jgi:hypothetical protein